MAAPHKWDDLQAFLAVARAGRLTEAARAMGVEHTTLSRRITRLETALGAKLFDRRPTGYNLSVEGELLLPRAEEIERATLGIWLDRVDPAVGLTGSVRIGTPEAFGTFCLAERLGEFSTLHPGLSIELVATPRAFSLSKREADLAIGLARPATGRLRARKLGEYELGLYGSPTYIARQGGPKDHGDLHRHRFIGYIDDLVFSPELDYFATALPGLQPIIRISNVITQMVAARNGAGLCILPCFMADKYADLVRLLPQSFRITRTYWLLTHADMSHLKRIKVASDFIASVVRAARPAFLPSST
ncbi:LysR family transcriptional regulator [Methylobacterium planeticum]|uniref:LysR family transcriptional regulator n=1 Tax=Methylobacterium planeticum TaxID=2615211 RepID=A0A6N6MKE5_9HYPH|nr:LysR family transcriptional regulator [Methylobacterium planeticum]KAB1071666.1 LysR family transcriptional regulator [Methylobacterium planeticum]